MIIFNDKLIILCYDLKQMLQSMKNMTKHLSSSNIYNISFNCFYLIQLHDISMFIFKSDCINHVEINMLNRLCVFIRLLFLHLYKTIILLCKSLETHDYIRNLQFYRTEQLCVDRLQKNQLDIFLISFITITLILFQLS